MLDRELLSRGQQLHGNSASLEKQERETQRALDALRRDNDKLEKLAVEHTKKVLEIGNVQNWAEMLEREFCIIEDTLRMVREGGSSGSIISGTEGSWSGSESGSGSWVSGGGGSDEGRRSRSRSAERRENGRDGDGDVTMDEGVDDTRQDDPRQSVGDKGKGRAVDLLGPMATDTPESITLSVSPQPGAAAAMVQW